MHIKQFLLSFLLLLLVGCNQLAQHNMFPNSRFVLFSAPQHPTAGVHVPGPFTCVTERLPNLFNAINRLGCLFNDPISFFDFSFFADPPREPAVALSMDPARALDVVIYDAQAVADRAILIIDEFIKKSFYVIGFGGGLHLSTLAADVAAFAVASGLTLTSDFHLCCSSVSAGASTPEAVVKLATASVLCALYNVCHVVGHACMVCNTVHRIVANLGRAAVPRTVARAQAAANKATTTTLIAALAAHLTIAFAVEHLVGWYATAPCVAQGHLVNANDALIHSAVLAVAGANLVAANDVFDQLVMLSAQPVDGIPVVSTDAAYARVVMSIIKAAAARVDVAANANADLTAAVTAADHANVAAVCAYISAFLRIPFNSSALDFHLVQTAFATHLAKAPLSSYATSSG